MLLRSTLALLSLCALFAPGAARAQNVAVAEAQAYHKGFTSEELKRLQELYLESLKKAGVSTIQARGKDADLRAAEFVTSLSIGKIGEDFIVTGQVSRFRLDRWAARAEARSPADDAGALVAAIDQVASGVAQAVKGAPPRSLAEPPRKKREHRGAKPSGDEPRGPVVEEDGGGEEEKDEGPDAG